MPLVFLSFWNYSVFLCLLGISIDIDIEKLTLDSLGKERFDFSRELHSVMSQPSICPFLIKNLAQRKEALAQFGEKIFQDGWDVRERMMVESKLGLERWILPHFGAGAVPYVCPVYLKIVPTTKDPAKIGLLIILGTILDEISESRGFHQSPEEIDLAIKWQNDKSPGKMGMPPTQNEEACTFIASKLQIPADSMIAMFGKSPNNMFFVTSQ